MKIEYWGHNYSATSEPELTLKSGFQKYFITLEDIFPNNFFLLIFVTFICVLLLVPRGYLFFRKKKYIAFISNAESKNFSIIVIQII